MSDYTTPIEERNMLLGLRQGRESALQYFYNKYYKMLLWYGMSLLWDEFTISCIVQEAFLKIWEYRERMESPRHIYCFLRQEVTWKTYAWLRKPSNRFVRQWVRNGETEMYSDDFARYEAEDTALRHAYDEERSQLIRQAISFLPPTYQNLMELYLTHGVGYRQLAKRMGATSQRVSQDVKKALDKIRAIIHAQKSITSATDKREMPDNQVLDGEMLVIFKMRYEQRLPFDTIAYKTGNSIADVQRQYLQAHKKLASLKGHKTA